MDLSNGTKQSSLWGASTEALETKLTKNMMDWLKTQGVAPVAAANDPALVIRFLNPTELQRLACQKPCRALMMAQPGVVYVSSDLHLEVEEGSPPVLAQILGQLIRLIQIQDMQARGLNSCIQWHQNNVRNVILQSQYLAAQEKSIQSLEAPEVPSNCTYGN